MPSCSANQLLVLPSDDCHCLSFLAPCMVASISVCSMGAESCQFIFYVRCKKFVDKGREQC